MEREAPNLSTEYQPKGSGRNPSDTLDKAVSAQDKLARPTARDPSKRSTGEVVDEKGRPLTGDGLVEGADTGG